MIKRTIFEKNIDSINAYSVTVIIGARQLAQNDPSYFIKRYGYPLIIDEVQYAPVLMEVIEEIVNNKILSNEKSVGLFVLTGSQKFKLMKGVTQSMAGRAGIFGMEPLSLSEIVNKKEIPFLPSDKMIDAKVKALSTAELHQQIIKGFYPEIYNNENLTSGILYSRYVSTYIERDIDELLEVKDKNKFYYFMQVLASITAQQLNASTISRIVGVSVPTIKQWLSILEASVFAGAFMETFVMNEIRKPYLNNGKSFTGMYYRDSNQNEIDLILLENAKLHFVEIKKRDELFY
ncbi:MAG: ATP-binding protein [Anaerorhabdus sp.]